MWFCYWWLTYLPDCNNCLSEVEEAMWVTLPCKLPNRSVNISISSCSDGFGASNSTFFPNSYVNTHYTSNISIWGLYKLQSVKQLGCPVVLVHHLQGSGNILIWFHEQTIITNLQRQKITRWFSLPEIILFLWLHVATDIE